MTLWLTLGLVATSYVSEDAALAGGALLARNGSLPALTAAAAVGLGIWTGDIALYAAGRLARRWAPVSRWIDRRWSPARLVEVRAGLERGVAVSLVLSRFTPGARLPLYVASGMLAVRTTTFIACTGAATAIWTGAVVLGVSWI